jgi:Fibronectin type III domain
LPQAIALVLLTVLLGAFCSRAATATGRPERPRTLEVKSVSRTSVQLSWVQPPGPVRPTGFRIYVNGVLRATVRAASYRVEGLSCGTSYVLAVGAYDGRGRSAKLRSRTVRTAQCGGGCFASPGSCGYPDPAYGNVGVPAGTKLRPSGSITVTTPGTVVSGRSVSGEIDVKANNVTIENTRVTMTGDGCGMTNTCGNANIHLLCSCTVTISHVELTTDSGTTVEHAIRNSYGGTIRVDHVYQHGNTDALCYCGNATITDSYSTIDLAISQDHLENLYIDGDTDDVEHNTLINHQPQTANIFGNTNAGNGGPCSNHLTVKNNLLAGGGYTIYPCGNATSVGSATLDFESNMIARCRGGTEVEGAGGTWLCRDGADRFGLFPRGGSFGHVADDFCGSPGWTWKNNVWGVGGTVAC